MSQTDPALGQCGAFRRKTRVVAIGAVRIGGDNPIAVQSMTNTPTRDVRATVAQAIALAEAGCKIVRVTAPNIEAAKALADIRHDFSAAGFAAVPLVADIHFLPAAAMEAALHVEKVRINPGNFADRKLAAPKDYTDAEYAAELDKLREAVTPLILRCRELGRAIRIGVNHGSLSDRVMNRYGDSPEGMCESALEFLRICGELDFHDIVVSLKASNPRVMLAATRLAAARLDAEGFNYPLHLGVTEAGGGEDARVKSAIGIGTILAEGLGDTIRVSLTEDPVAEVPVAKALAEEAMRNWAKADNAATFAPQPSLTRPGFARRTSLIFPLAKSLSAGGIESPRVILHVPSSHKLTGFLARLAKWHAAHPLLKVEALVLPATTPHAVEVLPLAVKAATAEVLAVIAELAPAKGTSLAELLAALPPSLAGLPLALATRPESAEDAAAAFAAAKKLSLRLVFDVSPDSLETILPEIAKNGAESLAFTSTHPVEGLHPALQYRRIAAMLDAAHLPCPIWLRHTKALMEASRGKGPADDTATIMDAALLAGGLLCDGIGDLVSVETFAEPERAVEAAYSILQGSRTRRTRTEFVACPSCGRTLFDLEATTKRIREATGHLTGVTIAVMGCIVNGPGEMADADFGYVGGAPGKVNLYVGKTPVEFNIPSAEAVDHLVALIKARGRWVDKTR
jgi:(E)-4-hydroxy-3-methylbut-2-enyl-diphosphate synthase